MPDFVASLLSYTRVAVWLATVLVVCGSAIYFFTLRKTGTPPKASRTGAPGLAARHSELFSDHASDDEGHESVPASASKVLRQTIASAKKLVRPFFHVETELDQDDGEDSDIINASAFPHLGRRRVRTDDPDGSLEYPLTPLTARRFNVTKQRRAMANAHIRQRLDKVPADEMAAPFKVHACTWNVDQRPPPEYSTAFLSWLLGAELANEIDKYHMKRQEILSAPSHAAGDGRAPSSRNSNAASPTASTRSSHLLPPHPSPIDRTPTSQRTAGRLPLRRRSPQVAAAGNQSLEGPTDKEKNDHESRARRLARSDATMAHLLKEFPDLIVVTLQEVDMGGVALVKESTLSSTRWTDAIIEAIHLAADRQLYYKRLKVVQLVGLMLIVLVQARHADYISHVRLSLTRTGAMRVLGNKGSVAMRATIYGKRFLFITAHFAAHKHNEERRMYNYHAALNDLRFEMPAFTDDESEVLRTFVNANANTASLVDSFVAGRSAWDRLFRVFDKPFASDTEARVLDEHDYIFFLGDLNSRLHAVDGQEIRERIACDQYDQLLIHDEVRQGMVYGEVFDGFEEQWIRFPPTYKFDRGTSTYDTSRKKRDPAWCDRVLFRVLDPSAPAQQPIGMEDDLGDDPLPGCSAANANQGVGGRPNASSSESFADADTFDNSTSNTGKYRPSRETPKSQYDDDDDDDEANIEERQRGGSAGTRDPVQRFTAGSSVRSQQLRAPSQEWVALGEIANLGFEESTSIADFAHYVTDAAKPSAARGTSADASAGTGTAAAVDRNENSYSAITADASVPSSSASTVSSPCLSPTLSDSRVAHLSPPPATRANVPLRGRQGGPMGAAGRSTAPCACGDGGAAASVQSPGSPSNRLDATTASTRSEMFTEAQSASFRPHGGEAENPGSLTAGEYYVSPAHPVWKQKQCDETFKAVRKPFDFRNVEVRFPMIPNHVNAIDYFCVSELKQSDHRPVCARFEVKVISLKAELVSGILEDLQNAITSEDAAGEASPSPFPSSPNPSDLQPPTLTEEEELPLPRVARDSVDGGLVHDNQGVTSSPDTRQSHKEDSNGESSPPDALMPADIKAEERTDAPPPLQSIAVLRKKAVPRDGRGKDGNTAQSVKVPAGVRVRDTRKTLTDSTVKK